MQYDVLEMSTRTGQWRGPIRYQSRVGQNAKVLWQEEEHGETGETILVQRPESNIPTPDSHYVICRNEKELEPWRVYAGPFSEEIAVEISEALQAVGK